MANFNNIKHEIDQNVNTNGVQAITGAILNETLKDMIDEVDSKKQDTLVAGQNITITGNVISASEGSGEEYYAGHGINIDSGNNISVDASDLAGSGLEVDEFGALKTDPLVVQGKLTPSGVIKINNNNSIYLDYGNGLKDGGDYLMAKLGSGLQFDQNGAIEVDDTVVATQSDLSGLQPALTAGSNIQINGTTISATDTTYSAGQGLNLNGTTFSADTTVLATKSDLQGKQDTLQAGDGLEIDQNNEISVKAGSGLGFDSNGYLINTGGGGQGQTLYAGDGIEIDSNDAINAKLGNGLQLDANNNIEIDPYVVATQSDLGSYLGLGGGTLQAFVSGEDTELKVLDTYGEDYVDIVAPDTPGEKPHIEIFENGSGDTKFFYDHIERGSQISIDLPSSSGTIALTSDLSGKQDTLQAGANIQINGNTISATDTNTTYSAGSGLDLNGTTFSVDTTTIQEKLVAGQNITITGNTISASGGSGQSYVAGSGIDITGNTISVDNTVATTSDLAGYLPLTGGNLQASSIATEVRVKSPSDDSYVYLHAVDSASPDVKLHRDIQNPSNGDVHEIDIKQDRVDIERWDQSGNTWMANSLYFPQFKTGTIALDSDLAGKQDTLTAGSGITIQNNVISATGGGGQTYSAGNGLNLNGTTFSVDTSTIQEKLVAGSNITINGNVISASGGSGSGLWVNGTGTNSLMAPATAASANTTSSGVGSLNAGIDDTEVGHTRSSLTSGDYSANFGLANWVQGDYSGAVGKRNKAIGEASFAIGRNNIATGRGSFAGGYGDNINGQPEAKGEGDFAFNGITNGGYYNVAINGTMSGTGGHNFALGGEVGGLSTNPAYSVSIGQINGDGTRSATRASYSIALGGSTYGEHSITIGPGTATNNDYEIAVGSYNKSWQSSNNAIRTSFSIGNGEYVLGGSTFKNALEVKKNNDIYVAGVGGYDGTNGNSGSNQSLQTVLNGKQDQLTAGSGITISGNVISATGGGGGNYLSLDGGDLKNTAVGAGDTALTVLSPNENASFFVDSTNGAPDDPYNPIPSSTEMCVSGDNGALYINNSGIFTYDYVEDGGGTGVFQLPYKSGNYTLATLDDIPSASSLAGDGLQDDGNGALEVKLGSGLQFDANGAIETTGGGSSPSYSAGTGISISAQNVISNTAPDPGLWVAGTGTDSIMSFNATGATNSDTVAIGYHARATANNACAVGANSNALAEGAVAAGGYVSGNYGFATRGAMIQSGQYSVAMGYNSTVSSNYSMALGYNTTTTTGNEYAFGDYNKSYNSNQNDTKVLLSIGNGSSNANRLNALEIKGNNDLYIYGVGGFTGANASSASTLQAVLSGKQDLLTAGSGITIQNNVISATGGGGGSLWTSGTGTDSLVSPGAAAGVSSDASGTGAITVGYDAVASGDYSFAQGGASVASGDYSFAANNGTASGDYSAAFSGSGAYGDNSFAAGGGSIAGPDYSVALGGGQVIFDDSDPDNIIDAQYGVAIGDGSVVNGEYGLALIGGVASASHSVAIGDASTASEMYSTALTGSTSQGNYSFAASTGVANGHYSSAFGGGNAQGEGSLASGFATSAYGYCSAALGYSLSTYDQADGTTASDPNAGEVALGRYNYSEADIVFTVGCGYLDETDPDNPEEVRENAVAITNDGKIYLKGLGGYTGQSVSGCTDLVSFLNNL